MNYKPLPRSFFERKTVSVARELLGKILVRRTVEGVASGRIIETEAYRGEDDPASHAYRGPTKRNRLMFGRGGFAYVYFVYGSNWCLNATTEPAGIPGAVLIRAMEPLSGLEFMTRNRSLGQDGLIRTLTNGPGKLTQAMDISGELNGTDLTKIGKLFICGTDGADLVRVATTGRIGVRNGSRRPWRFYVKGNDFVTMRSRVRPPK